MGTSPTKASSNIYCQARLTAAMYNEKLKSREGAAELLGISTSTLSDYELGITKNVPVDKVVRRADLYNAPELCNLYCSTECPIGCRNVPRLSISEPERLTIQLIAAFRQSGTVEDNLLEILADGVVTNEELPQLEKPCLFWILSHCEAKS